MQWTKKYRTGGGSSAVHIRATKPDAVFFQRKNSIAGQPAVCQLNGVANPFLSIIIMSSNSYKQPLIKDLPWKIFTKNDSGANLQRVAHQNRCRKKNMKISLYERTEYQIIFDLHYGQRYCLLASQFYGRIAWIFSVLTIFCGSAAFAGWYASDPGLSLYPALLLSFIAAINLTWKPSEKRLVCELERQKWNALIKDAANLSVEQVDEKINTIRAINTPEIGYLRDVAFNDVLLEQDQKEGFVELGLMSKACAFIAA